MNMWQKLVDMTYWRFRRWRRVCGYCGNRSNIYGKVNFGIAFEKPKNYYHEACLNIYTGKATPSLESKRDKEPPHES